MGGFPNSYDFHTPSNGCVSSLPTSPLPSGGVHLPFGSSNAHPSQVLSNGAVGNMAFSHNSGPLNPSMRRSPPSLPSVTQLGGWRGVPGQSFANVGSNSAPRGAAAMVGNGVRGVFPPAQMGAFQAMNMDSDMETATNNVHSLGNSMPSDLDGQMLSPIDPYAMGTDFINANFGEGIELGGEYPAGQQGAMEKMIQGTEPAVHSIADGGGGGQRHGQGMVPSPGYASLTSAVQGMNGGAIMACVPMLAKQTLWEVGSSSCGATTHKVCPCEEDDSEVEPPFASLPEAPPASSGMTSTCFRASEDEAFPCEEDGVPLELWFA
eukprot:TRINITY_DN1247_c0_g3_i6.p1 TRINITY_DN1247_c0_g3~~TRINITY_DN1247_c0_g3_i6.p1  ORF type:complete len:321 (+),score=43.76 TRINITY_DN1247_c0_g3_i6:950-1912(+)